MISAARSGGDSPATGAAPSPPRVGITRLVLTDFRNYREARLELETRPVVLTGANGAGKTNLIEAVSFLVPGRGLRGARLGEIDRRDRPDGAADGTGWGVAATIATGRGQVRVGTGREGGGERRVVHIDGDPARGQAALGEIFAVTWLTPQMDRLFAEGPGGRRRLLDRLVLGLDPAHAGRVAAYEQALRERARLLRDGPADPVWLAALEEIMATKGVAVAAARRELVGELGRICAAAPGMDAGSFPRPRLALLGAVEAWLDEMPALAAEDRFKAALRTERAGDAALGGAATGPHRTDLAVADAASGVPAERGSTGEQKALLIAILLGHARLQRARRGEPPVLLLDEVAAHLDRDRRAALFEALTALDSQVWLTGTDTAVFTPLRQAAQFFTVAEGTLGATQI